MKLYSLKNYIRSLFFSNGKLECEFLSSKACFFNILNKKIHFFCYFGVVFFTIFDVTSEFFSCFALIWNDLLTVLTVCIRFLVFRKYEFALGEFVCECFGGFFYVILE